MSDKYILEGRTPVLEPDVFKWGKWFETANRYVAETQISDNIRVSTVFLGLNHNFGEGIPILFETMVFGGELDQEVERYSTWTQAEQGHKRWVIKTKAAIALTKEETMAGQNIHKEPIRVKHSELKRSGDSVYKSICPACDRGLLLMQRDQETLKLLTADRCIFCGQSFEYIEMP